MIPKGTILYNFSNFSRLSLIYWSKRKYFKTPYEAAASSLFKYSKPSNRSGIMLVVKLLRDINGDYFPLELEDNNYPFKLELSYCVKLDLSAFNFQVGYTENSILEPLTSYMKSLKGLYKFNLYVFTPPADALEYFQSLVRGNRNPQEVLRSLGCIFAKPPELLNPQRFGEGISSEVKSGYHNGRRVTRKSDKYESIIKECIIFKYLDIVSPGHTPKLLNIYEDDDYYSDRVILEMEYIEGVTLTQIDTLNLDPDTYLHYVVDIIESLLREVNLGIEAGDINTGNIILAFPIDKSNSRIYRIDYGMVRTFFEVEKGSIIFNGSSRDFVSFRDNVFTRTKEILSIYLEIIEDHWKSKNLPKTLRYERTLQWINNYFY